MMKLELVSAWILGWTMMMMSSAAAVLAQKAEPRVTPPPQTQPGGVRGATRAPAPKHDPPGHAFRRAPMPEGSRSVVIPLATNLHVAFDPELLRSHTAWMGMNLSLYGPPFHGGKTPFLARAEGTILWQTPQIFPWSSGAFPTNDAQKAPSGTGFRGISTKGGGVTLLYEVPGKAGQAVAIRESMERGAEPPAIRRRFQIQATDADLWFLAHGELSASVEGLQDRVLLFSRKTDVLAAVVRGPAEWKSIVRHVRYDETRLEEKEGESAVAMVHIEGPHARGYVHVFPHAQPVEIEVVSGVFQSREEALNGAREWSTGAPRTGLNSDGNGHGDGHGDGGDKTAARGPIRFKPDATAVRPDGGDEFYRIERFPVPREIDLLVGGMDWLGNGDLAICTWPGDVFIVESAQGPVGQAVYRRFAEGLNEPLGLRVMGDAVLVVQKPELTRLRDTDGDGQADQYETVSSDWGYTGNYHAYAFGPVVKRNDFYVYLTGQRGLRDFPYLGWAVRIDPMSGRAEPFCSGLRAPNGFGTFGDGEDLFCTDNQGNWIGACKLNHLRSGKFYGYPSSLPAPESEYRNPKEFEPPAVWFPKKLSASASGFAVIRDARFGPFQGQMMVGEFQNGTVLRVMLEKVDGQWQGAVWPFAKGFLGAVNRVIMGPDGALYVGGCKRTWSTPAPQEYSLERVRFTGKIPFEVSEAKATSTGFVLHFTKPVDPMGAADLDNYYVGQHTYRYHAEYGSPEIDHEGMENSQTEIAVRRAELSGDGTSLRLDLTGLKEGCVTTIRLGEIRSATGEPLWHDTFYYTLNRIPGV